jgi:hypothetical protein
MGPKRCSIIEESKKQAFPFFMTGGIYKRRGRNYDAIVQK